TGGAARQELDFDSAKASSRSRPFALTACIVGAPSCLSVPPSDPQYHGRSIGWRGPTFGHVGLYQVSRKRGIPSSAFPYVNPTPTSTTTATSFIDVEQLPD